MGCQWRRDGLRGDGLSVEKGRVEGGWAVSGKGTGRGGGGMGRLIGFVPLFCGSTPPTKEWECKVCELGSLSAVMFLFFKL